MAALDNNILVRYPVEDDAAQLAAAKKLFRTALAAGETLFISITVTLELEWVLRSNFKFNKEQITTTLSSLLAAAELTFESESAAEIALALYKKSNADFMAGESPLWTFDRAAAKIDGAKLLTSQATECDIQWSVTPLLPCSRELSRQSERSPQKII